MPNSSDILEKLNQEENFTDTENGVVQYMRNHLRELPDLSIRELAQTCYVANGTVLRICRKLGFKGYSEFKAELIRQLEAGKYTVDNVNFDHPFETSKDDLALFDHMAALYRKTIDLMQKYLDVHQVIEAEKVIRKCHILYIYAIGDSEISCESFYNRLAMLGRIPVIATNRSQYRGFTATASENDAALFVSYGGNWEMFTECILSLKKKGTPVITITSNPDSIISRFADIRILIPAMETDEKMSTFYSQISFSYILNMIYSLYYQKREQKSLKQ